MLSQKKGCLVLRNVCSYVRFSLMCIFNNPELTYLSNMPCV